MHAIIQLSQSFDKNSKAKKEKKRTELIDIEPSMDACAKSDGLSI